MPRANERQRRETELGTELRCACCGEFWPEDPDFFFFAKGVPHSWCKACYRSNPKTIEKVQRWSDRQRKNPAPPPAPLLAWGPLLATQRALAEVLP